METDISSETQQLTVENPGPRSEPFGVALRRVPRDWVFWVTLLVLATILIPFSGEIFDEEQQWWWNNVWVNLLLQGTVLLALFLDPSDKRSEREERFWRFLKLSVLSIFAVYVAWGIAEWIQFEAASSVGMELFTQVLYLGFYLFLVFALDSSRSIEEAPVDQELHRLRAAGLGILLFGLMAYFGVVPVVVNREDPLAWIPILFSYAALDLLLCLLALRARRASESPRWRSIMGWMSITMGAYAIVDLQEAAGYAGWMLSNPYGSLADLQWYVPVLILVLGARIHLTSNEPDSEVLQGGPVLLRGGPLVVYALALPLLHFLLHSLTIIDPDVHDLQEITAFGTLALIGFLALVYEQKVRRRNRVTHTELQESRERYSSFVTMSAEGIWLLEFDPPIPVTDPDRVQAVKIFKQGRVVESNDAMAEMYGFHEAREIEGRLLSEILDSVKESRRNREATLQFVRGSYRVRRETFEFQDGDGTKRYGEGSLVGVIEGENLVRAWATQVDVTARLKAEQEKEKLEEQLRRAQRLETIGTLAGGIAHDFNNILAPVLGFAEMAEATVDPEDSDTLRSLDRIKGGALRAKELVSQILAVGQKRESVRESVDVSEVVSEAVILLRQGLPATVRLETDFERNCPPAWADSTQLHQIVMNLCTNSQQAMPESQGTVELKVSWTELDPPPDSWNVEPGQFVVLTVTDDGKGMPREVADRALEPFFTTKSVGKGSGLGLSVTHGIVEEHGGHMELSSEEGRGTMVRIYVPAANPEVQERFGGARPIRIRTEDQAEERLRHLLPGTPGDTTETAAAAGFRIMVVDDELGVAETCERMLQVLGHRVSTFTDSRLALDTIEQDPFAFDLLVTDHTMPSVTGPQLVEAVRMKNPDMPVIVASGHRFGEKDTSDEEVLLLGKPYTVQELQTTVEEAMRKQPA